MSGQYSQRRHPRRRHLQIEALERRDLMNAAPIGLPDSYSVLQGQLLQVQAPVTAATTSAELPNLLEANSFQIGKAALRISYSQQYQRIATLGEDHSVTIYDSRDGHIISELDFSDELLNVEVTPDGKYFYVPQDLPYLHRYNCETNTWEVKQFPIGGSTSASIQPLDNNRFLLYESLSHSVRLWDYGPAGSAQVVRISMSAASTYGGWAFNENTGQFYGLRDSEFPGLELFQLVGDSFERIGRLNNTPVTLGLVLSAEGTELYSGFYQFGLPSLTVGNTFGETIIAGAGQLAFGYNSYWNARTGAKLGTFATQYEAVTVSLDASSFWGFDKQTSSLTQYRIPGTVPGLLSNDTDADLDSLTASLVAAPAHGTVTLKANGYFEYLPNPQYQGVDQFTYRAFDGVAYSDPVTVQINVWPYFDGALTTQSYQATEDQTLVVSAANGLVRSALDSAGQAVQATLDSAPRYGTVTINANGSFQYAPRANYFGSDSFTYRLSGDGQTWQTGAITLNVSNTPDLPTIGADNYRTYEDQTILFDRPIGPTTTQQNFTGLRLQQSIPYTATVSQMEFSARYNTLAIREDKKVTLIDAATGAVVTTATTGARFTDLSYTADGRYLFIADYNGDSISSSPTYIRRYDLQTKTWVTKQSPRFVHELEPIDEKTLLTQNEALFLYDFGSTDSLPMSELSKVPLVPFTSETTSSFEVQYNPQLQQLYVGRTSTSTLMSIYQLENSQFKLLAVPVSGITTDDYNLTMSFDQYFVYYGSHSVDLRYGNYSLKAYPDNIGSVANSIVFAGSAYYNSFTRQRLGDLTFTPSAITTDEISHSVWMYNSSTKQLLQYHVPGSYAHPAVNDVDPDGDALTFTVLTGTSRAPLIVNADGSLSYTPPLNFSGTDSFVYEVTDSAGNTVTATATIDILPVNDAPVAVSDKYFPTEEQTLIVTAANGLLANDTDPDGNSLTILSYTQPTNGTVTVALDGSFVFTPNPNAFGKDLFNYTVTDGYTTSTTEVLFSITGTPDDPVSSADSYAVNEDTTLSASSSRNLLSNDTNVDNTGSFAAVLVTPPSSGTLVLNAVGTFSYLPAKDFNGAVTFGYRAFDGTRYSNVTTATITVAAVNDAPLGATDVYSLPWGASSLTINAATGVLINDSDVEGSALTATLLNQPTRGTVTFNSNGSFTYTRGSNYVTSDSFRYQLSDGTSTATATAFITLDTGRIELGNFTLLPNTPNQQIPIYITGGAPLTAINLRMQIGDGLNGTPEPVISAVSYANTIWSGQITDTLGGPSPGSQPVVQSSIAFREAGVSVLSNGKVAMLTIDTTGIYGGSFALLLRNTQIGQNSDIIVLNGAASPLILSDGTITITPAAVTLRQTFYNNSYFDDFNPAITPADLATAAASEKTALLPGQAATLANYTSYSKGINGVVIEVENIQYQPLLSEFEFRTGNTATPDTWTLLTVAPTMTTESLGAGKVRIYFTWPDGTITKQWLEVLVKAKGPMGLPQDDVFYFGNAIGDTGFQAGNAYVDGTDYIYTRDNTHTFMNRATITDPADFNRDSLVDATDLALTRDNSSNFISALRLFTPPAHVTPARTPYVPPTIPSPSFVLERAEDFKNDSSSVSAARYAASLASVTKTTIAADSAAVLVPTPAAFLGNTPSLAAIFAQLAVDSKTTADDAGDHLFLTLRKKRFTL